MRRHSINQVYSSPTLIFFVKRDLSFATDSHQLDEPTLNWSLQKYDTPSPFDNLLQNKIIKNDTIDVGSNDFVEQLFDLDFSFLKKKEKVLMVSEFIIEPFKPKFFIDDLLLDDEI